MKNKVDGYKRLLSYLKPYKKLLILSVFFMILVSLSNLVVPWIIKDVIDQVLENKDLGMLYIIIVVILATFFIRALTTFGHRYFDGVYRSGGHYGYTECLIPPFTTTVYCLL